MLSFEISFDDKNNLILSFGTESNFLFPYFYLAIIPENTEEDNWRYVERSLAKTPMKPVLDGEPSYEKIPQGLHDPNEPLWQDFDCRRYAYWSVFAGAFGHTYGHNDIMQFYRPGTGGAYGAHTLV